MKHIFICQAIDVNNQNYRFWATEKPNFTIQAPLYPQRITVWAAMSRKHMIGPIFITETVNSDVYMDILQTSFFPALKQRRIMCKAWFQQDGATPHTANRVMQLLKENLGVRIISKGLWPPRSPDLSPCDFFLLGFLNPRSTKASRIPRRTKAGQIWTISIYEFI
jgi:hypothetical protein